ncbi:hypothetical protein FCULG_00012773 [Fusarium culmorum]|uniref:Uncharacterized protein n=1 Tax=Fusarium culmorum TaxID=5516 RepID=A0A2T4GIT3_FUSCU|nr:hypothetical protein FCULG_00012773 [Fusarium culmorum]
MSPELEGMLLPNPDLKKLMLESVLRPDDHDAYVTYIRKLLLYVMCALFWGDVHGALAYVHKAYTIWRNLDSTDTEWLLTAQSLDIIKGVLASVTGSQSFSLHSKLLWRPENRKQFNEVFGEKAWSVISERKCLLYQLSHAEERHKLADIHTLYKTSISQGLEERTWIELQNLLHASSISMIGTQTKYNECIEGHGTGWNNNVHDEVKEHIASAQIFVRICQYLMARDRVIMFSRYRDLIMLELV